jgi:hypothetical protein
MRDETRVDGRIGVEARGVLPLTSLLRVVAALDAELAPRGIGGDDHAMGGHDRPSAFPAYTIGLGVGMEVAIR